MAEETEEQLRQSAVMLKTSMTELNESVHFKRFLVEINNQIKQRESNVFGFPDGGLDTVVKNIYTTGEIAGLRMVLEFTNIMIDFAQQTIDVSDMRAESKRGVEENG